MRSRTDGFSLVELLVGMLFLSTFALAVHQFCSTLLRGVRVLEVASEAQESARLGVQLIVAAVREAGFTPAGPLPDGVRRAAPDLLEIARDLNGDGDVDDANERVSFQYAPDTHTLLQGLGGAAPQPLLDGLDDDGLVFTYRAADGTPLVAASGELDAVQRALIRRVDVRLAIAIRNPDPAYTQPLRAAQSATATLRNIP
jgi:Tfp pilus assembly protein PilW